MTIVYWPQPSSVVLCIQNIDFSVRISSLYWTQPSFVVFACKTATLGQELQVSIGPRPHQWFFSIQNSDFSTRIASLYVVPALICGFVHSQQRYYDQTYLSLWHPDLTCHFVHVKQRD